MRIKNNLHWDRQETKKGKRNQKISQSIHLVGGTKQRRRRRPFVAFAAAAPSCHRRRGQRGAAGGAASGGGQGVRGAESPVRGYRRRQGGIWRQRGVVVQLVVGG